MSVQVALGYHAAQAPAKGCLSLDTLPFSDDWKRYSQQCIMRQPQWLCVLFTRSQLAWILSRCITGGKDLLPTLQHFTKPELCRILAFGTYGILKENRKIRFSCPIRLFCSAGSDRMIRRHNRLFSEKAGLPLSYLSDTGSALTEAIDGFLTQLI